jgi:hypothetical protein
METEMKTIFMLLLVALPVNHPTEAANARMISNEFRAPGDLIHNPECASILHDEFFHLLCDAIYD